MLSMAFTKNVGLGLSKFAVKFRWLLKKIILKTNFHVCVTLGTRPEAIKLAPVIHLLRNNPEFYTSVILTGQHREMVAQVMQLFDLKADYDLGICLLYTSDAADE